MYIPNVYRHALQCIYPMYIRMHCNVYTQCIYECTAMYMFFYVNLLPNVYKFVTQCIFNIHWVYTLGCIRIYIGLQDIYIVLHFLSHNVYSKKCYTMYIRQNALQCISAMLPNVYKMQHNVYGTLYIQGRAQRGVYTLGCILYTFGCILIYIAGVD